ncbi:MAG: extracellular solute-binding protein [Enterococcus casseliflavus]
MKRLVKISVLTGVALLALSLTGCGATGNKNSSKEVKFFNGKTESVELMDDLIEEFNSKNKDFKVVQEFQKDASSALQTKFASGDVPDIVSADITQDYIDNDLFLDLSKEDFWDNVDPSIKEMVTDVKSNKQFKVALAKSIGGVFYNKDIISEVKTDTWENFVSSIKTNKKDVTPMFLGGKDSWTLGQLMEFWGHGLVKQDYSIVEAKKYFIDNDQDVLKFAKNDGPIGVFAQRIESMKKDGIINENAATASYDDQIANFASGKVACIPQGIWAVSLIKEKNPDMNIGFAAFAPMEDGKKPVVLSAEDSTLGIPAKSKNQDGAKAFIKFLLEKENLKKYSETLHLPSAYSDVDSKWIDNPEEYESVIKDSVPVGFTVFPSGFSGDDSGRYVQAFLSGQYKTANDFVKAYSDAWNKAWDDSK